MTATIVQVAWYAMKEEPHELGPAVDKLVSSVIEQVGQTKWCCCKGHDCVH